MSTSIQPLLSETLARPSRTTGTSLSLRQISKLYNGVAAVQDLNLDIAAGEFVTLLGASGSGKTTTLMMLAGFVDPSSGDVFIGEQAVTGLPPAKRDLGVVFQNYALFPHLSVAQNLAFPLEMRGMRKTDVTARVQAILEMVQLGDKASRFPRELSGGQQQRVALARALIFNPRALLLDEPLGALDKNLREHMQLQIKALHQQLGTTTVMVTHDQEEALTLSDRVAVMHDGRIAQIGSPSTLYERPASKWVAEFIGQSNLLFGTIDSVSAASQNLAVDARASQMPPTGNPGRHAIAVLRLPDGTGIGGLCDAAANVGTLSASAQKRAVALLRPERFEIHRAPTGVSDDHTARFSATITATLYLGHTVKYSLRLRDGQTLVAQLPNAGTGNLPGVGDTVSLSIPAAAVWIMPDSHAADGDKGASV